MKRAIPHTLGLAAGIAAACLLQQTAALAQGPAHEHAQAPAAPSNDDVTPPSVLTHVDAQYPPSARASRKHGDVVLALTIDADGHVSKVDVFESGGADLDEAAIVAARQWTFIPAKRGGKPLASRIRVPFHFAPPAPPPELVPPPKPGAEPILAPHVVTTPSADAAGGAAPGAGPAAAARRAAVSPTSGSRARRSPPRLMARAPTSSRRRRASTSLIPRARPSRSASTCAASMPSTVRTSSCTSQASR
jgi:TonB family protein